MNIPKEAVDIIVLVIVIGTGMYLVHYFTKRSRKFRNSRNKKARKQL
jgi:hypothetical protein